MTILDSLGSQPAIIKAGEDPQLNLTPDAETLALFAGLFAMLQPQEEAGADHAAEEAATGPSVLSPGDAPTTNTSKFDALPTAAKLMVDAGPDGVVLSERPEMRETASLARLLIAAKSLSGEPGKVPLPGAPPMPDAEAGSPTDMTTARAILARAIEILDDIDSGPAQPHLGEAAAGLMAPSAPGPHIAADTGQIMSMPSSMVGMEAQLPPSPDFVGPMPAVSVGESPVRMVAQPAPSPAFVGPMPAVSVGEGPVRMVAQPAPSPAFVGPMPAMSVGENPVRMVAQPAPSPAFVGPMPAMPLQPVPLQPVPLQPVPLAGQGGVGQWHLDMPAMRESDYAALQMKGSLERKMDAGAALDQVKTRLQMAPGAGPRSGPGTAGSQPDTAMMQGVNSRDMRAYADHMALAGNQSSNGQSSNGQSSSISTSGSSSNGQSSTGQSSSASAQAVSGAGGQSGGQAGGQHQSGQGGGQSASQGFADAAPSRDLADRALLHRLNTANAGWTDTMIKRLTSDLRSGVQTVRIILEPRHLGRLNVDLGLRNGRASIRIAAETAEAAQLLGSARGQLGQMFEQSGMRLASFQTSAGGQEGAMDGGGGQQGQAQSHADGKNTGRDQGFSNKLTRDDRDKHQADNDPDDQDFVPRQGETAVLSVLA